MMIPQPISLPDFRAALIQTQAAQDGTTKFLWRLVDGQDIESVLIAFGHAQRAKYSICLSTQAGCALGCHFCYTATQGLRRHLTDHEIVAQYWQILQWMEVQQLAWWPLPNLVLMGQGEPLANFDAVASAIEILADPRGISLARRKITLSTAGHLPGLLRFPSLKGINLALSLHSAIETKRQMLMPIAQRYSLAQLFACLDQLVLRRSQYILLEYLLIDQLNDQPEDAQALVDLIQAHSPQGLRYLVNLIPFNPFPNSPFRRPSPERIEMFKRLLVQQKLRVFLRQERGGDILAACGQLRPAQS